MKSPAYKITFKDNTHAILAERLFEEEHGMIVDCRDGKTIYFSKDGMLNENDYEATDKDDIEKALEDICMVGELDGMPDIEEVDFDFDED